jgi:ribosomal protein L19
VDQAEYQLQEAIDSNSFVKLTTLIDKVRDENINVDIKILVKAKKEAQRMKMEIEINNFIGTLQFVENYKTIQKSIYLLKNMQENAVENGIKLEQKMVDKIHKETERLMAERNLRYQLDITGIADGTPEMVKKIDELARICEENDVSSTYIHKGRALTEKMKEIIESHNILRKFLDYPLREYPDFAPPDPKKKPNPAEEAKKKKGSKIPIPEWAEELPALVKAVEALEGILKKSAALEIPGSFIDQAKENIVRMRKEIKFRQMEEEEARALAEKKLADKNKKK